MCKLDAYVRDIPDLLVIGKILITQAEQYASPGSNGSVAWQLRSLDTMTREEWLCNHSANDFHRVVIDGHMWFSLSSVEIHIWTRQAGGLQIKLDHLDSNEYAVRRGFELIKEDVFWKLVTTNVDQSLLDHMEAWLPPCCALDSTLLTYALVLGA
ncbi:hypothetical protein BKA83DRAFT_4128209 [Pisolithus microcarpus]|nr:hypothetical protein BKA83DRAFT_4128209 [Pisolithus microcarpus]